VIIILLVQNSKDEVEEYNIKDQTVFPYLRQLSDLTEDESKKLIEDGISIGRPHGYTFSAKGFLYLLSLHVDLFGFIKADLAKDVKSLSAK
jgi:hypothetical protein